MVNTTFDRYVEADVLSAGPVKLVRILYWGALEAVGEARSAPTRTDDASAIGERSRQILKARQIVQELSSSLDHRQGGDLSRRLAELYAHVGRRLLDANIQETDAPLAEAEAILTTLSEAWAGISDTAPQPVEEPHTPVPQ